MEGYYQIMFHEESDLEKNTNRASINLFNQYIKEKLDEYQKNEYCIINIPDYQPLMISESASENKHSYPTIYRIFDDDFYYYIIDPDKCRDRYVPFDDRNDYLTFVDDEYDINFEDGNEQKRFDEFKHILALNLTIMPKHKILYDIITHDIDKTTFDTKEVNGIIEIDKDDSMNKNDKSLLRQFDLYFYKIGNDAEKILLRKMNNVCFANYKIEEFDSYMDELLNKKIDTIKKESINMEQNKNEIIDEKELKGLDLPLNQVKEFHESMNHPVGKTLHSLERKRKGARGAWMQEELDEFIQADEIVDEIDALIDLSYFVLGTLVEMGVKNPQEFFNCVQKSNMGKLWPDGHARYRHDGKVIKPSTWQAPEPEMLKIIERIKSEEEK